MYNSTTIAFDSIALSNTTNTGAIPDFFTAKVDISLPTALNEDAPANDLFIYPNPMRNELTIDFDKGEYSNVGISLYNSLGTVCYSLAGQHLHHKKTIDVSSLPSGVYLVELDIDGKKFVSKVIKE